MFQVMNLAIVNLVLINVANVQQTQNSAQNAQPQLHLD